MRLTEGPVRKCGPLQTMNPYGIFVSQFETDALISRGILVMKRQRNIRLVLLYDGGGYHGWQIQPGVLTIQEVIEESLKRITQERVRVVAAGRTDAGVHALAQVAHFHTFSSLPPETIARALNALLPSDIRVMKAEEVSHSFHARFSAQAKTYEYRIWNRPIDCPFLRRYSWWIPRPLDLGAMKEASEYLQGEHDFAAFKASGSEVKGTVRRVLGCGWEENWGVLRFWIEATGFLRYMVRSIVGTMVEIGLGKRPPEDIRVLLKKKDRQLCGPTAPARGLFLTGVSYPPQWSLSQDWECWSPILGGFGSGRHGSEGQGPERGA